MGVYLLKRILLALPTIWLIGSLVFLLSRLIPGTYADFQQETEQTIGNQAFITGRDKYLQQLQASGQDKPLFYFSIQSQADSDTLYKVFPVSHQQFLKKLIHQYGDWPLISAYYKSLMPLQAQINQFRSESQELSRVKVAINQLFFLTAQQEIKQQLPEIARLLANQERSDETRPLIERAKKSFDLLEQEAKPERNLLPRLQWNGRNNQYHLWLQGFIKLNLGNSYRDGRPVTIIIGEAIGNTLLLLLGSLFLIFGLAIELSIWLCRKKTKGRAFVLTNLYIIDTIPLFILAFLLLTFLAGSGYLNLFPVFGLGSTDKTNTIAAFLDRLHHLVLPAICLVLVGLPYITTQLYQAMQQVMHAEYVSTARAKGLSLGLVLRRHVFRNARITLITLFTGYLPGIISGALVVEFIFAIRGTGRLLTESVMARDYPVVLGLVIFIAAVQIAAHLLADYLYFKADPRTRIN